MHTNFYQFRTTFWKNKIDVMEVYEMQDRIMQPIDYIQRYKPDDEKETIKDTFCLLKDNGCDVNYDEQTFTITDREKFLSFLLGDGYFWTFEKTGNKWIDIGLIARAVERANYCRFPCLLDGDFYPSLFEAISYYLFPEVSVRNEKYEPITIEIVGVYDCHF